MLSIDTNSIINVHGNLLLVGINIAARVERLVVTYAQTFFSTMQSRSIDVINGCIHHSRDNLQSIRFLASLPTGVSPYRRGQNSEDDD